MATKNDVTGEAIKSRNSTQQYLDNWEAIFGKKEEAKPEQDSKDEGDK